MYALMLISTVTLLLSICCVTIETTAAGILFPSKGRYVFDLHTTTRVGDERADNPYSGWILRATLNADVVELNRIRITILNDKTSIRRALLWDGFKDPTSPPSDSQVLNAPWELHLSPSGAIESIYFLKDEPVWSSNIKRAISASLQLQTIGKGTPGSFTVTEPCLHGICAVEYTTTDGKVIRKSHGIPTSTPGPGRNVWASVLPDVCNQDAKQTLIGNTERMYTLNSEGLSHMELYAVIHLHTEKNILSSVTSLNITRNQVLPLPELLEKLEFTEASSVTYEPHSYREPSNGRSPIQQSQLIADAMMHLATITKTQRVFSEEYAKDILVKKQKPVLLLKLHSTISQLNLDSLQKMFEDLNVGTSYDQETMRNIFLEVLPQARSSDSAVFIRDLVLQQRLEDDYQTIQLVGKLPFSIAEYSEKLLTDMEPLMKLGRDFNQDLRFAGILSFATLVFKTYINNACSSDTFEGYVQVYFIRYTESPNYSDRLAWLQGLSNLQMGGVRAYLAPVISNATHDRHERFLAAWATLPLAPFNPIDTHRLYWPILLSPNEHLQMRVVAVTMLLVSDPSPRRMLSLQWHIERSGDPHLQHYWHTTLRSLGHTTYPCYKNLGKVASYIAEPTEKMIHSRYYATGNYLFDAATDKSDMSVMFQTMCIANPITDRVALAYFTISVRGEGFIATQISLYMKAEGVDVNVLNRLYARHTSLRTEELAKILQDMKISSQPNDQVHVELIFKIQDKAVYVLHMNQTSFDQWTDEKIGTTIRNLLIADSHINQQFVYYPIQIYNGLSTEFGTPLTRLHQFSLLSSVRGDLSHQVDESEKAFSITRHNHMQLGFMVHEIKSLVAGNPLLSSTHEASTEKSLIRYEPVDFNIAFSFLNQSHTLLRLWWDDHDSSVFGRLYKSGVHMEHTANLTADYRDSEQILATNKSLDRCTFAKDEYRTNYNVLQPILKQLPDVWDLYRSPSTDECLEVKAVQPVNVLYEHTLEIQDEPSSKFTIVDNIVGRRAENNESIVTRNFLLSIAPTDNELEIKFQFQEFAPNGGLTFKLRIDILERVHGDPETSSDGKLNIAIGGDRERELCLLRLTYAGNVSSDQGGAVRNYRVDLGGHYIDSLSSLPSLDNESLSSMAIHLFSLTGSAQPSIFKALKHVNNGTLSVQLQIGKDITRVYVLGVDDIQYPTEVFDPHFDSYTPLHALRSMRTHVQCVVNPTTLVDLSDTVRPWAWSPACKERLLLADCSSRPKFALLQHHLEGESTLAVTLYVGGNSVKIVPGTNDTTMVEVNGKAVDYEEGYTYPEFWRTYDFKVSAIPSGVVVAANDITLRWRRTQATLSLPRVFVRQLCGACRQSDQHYCTSYTAPPA